MEPTSRLKPAPAISSVVADQPVWHGGSQQRLTWDSAGDVAEVDINLYKGESRMPKARLAGRVPNTGSHVVTVPTGLPPGPYLVEVSSRAAWSVCSRSGPISIDPGATAP